MKMVDERILLFRGKTTRSDVGLKPIIMENACRIESPNRELLCKRRFKIKEEFVYGCGKAFR